ncbi:MAG: peroxiredoxin family protein [Aureispira sp.]
MNRLPLLVIILLFLGGVGCTTTQKGSKNNSKDTIHSTHKGEEEFQAYLDRKRNGFIGKKIPSLTIKGIDGKSYDPSKMKGKIVLLNFWFAACKPCMTEIASLNELQRKFKNDDLVVLSVSTDPQSIAEKLAVSKKMAYTVAANGKSIAESLKVVTFPTSFLVDQQGVIKEVFIGASADDATHTYSEVKPHIEALLK